MELNEFHQTDGWLFKRLDDGSVRIRNEALGVSHVIPAAEWVSVIAHCSPERGNDYAYSAAEAFHRSNAISVPQRPSAERLAEIRAFFTGGEGWVMKAVDDLFHEMNALRTEHDEACAHSLDTDERLHAVTRERDEWQAAAKKSVDAYEAFVAKMKERVGLAGMNFITDRERGSK